MKNIRLINLKLRNFKGIKEFELVTGQNDKLTIFGANNSGKTSTFDAFTWLLFDKDSNNKKDFPIKTLDESGKDIHLLEHEVSAVLDVDGIPLELKKVYKEKWTKKTGAIEKELTSHTTDHYINEVKATKKEYTARVAELIDEDTFKMITSPTYFGEQLKWQDQRDVVMTIAGDVTDQEVFESDATLAELQALLGNHSVSEKRKIATQKRKDINSQLDGLPGIIAELHRNLPDVSGLSHQEIEDEIQGYQLSKEEKEAELQNIRNGSHSSELAIQKAKIEGELQEIKNRHQTEVYADISKKRDQLSEMERSLYELQNNKTNIENTIQRMKNDITNNNRKRDDLREKWATKNAETFSQHRTTCPTCNQELPSEDIAAAEAKFNSDKAEELKAIADQGGAAGAIVETTEALLEAELTAIKELHGSIQNANVDIAMEKDNLAAMEANATKVENTGDYVTKYQELEEVKKQMEDSSQSATVRESEIRNAIGKCDNAMAALRTDLSKFETISNMNARIDELKAEQSKLSELFNEQEKIIYLTNQFSRAKAKLLEGRINNKFKLVRFKLFKELMNGGLEECCEATVEGVPYNSGLNTAARINGGLDIINSLNEHYQATATIFIDNRESVTDLIETKAQVISLEVSKKDKKLRVEEFKNE
ncbi:hypothetical protein PGRAN_02490 [Listeria grandensis FSL F6-0971]|uniref:Nuclease SbcCD subunit C n=1 Tax=Listeria grandensis FSL F6-0971 TaxID=1265819 RepID=W7BFN2_9LIST|nr:AAA family ATPase [Listeria grandensis]EUJ24727.1 hypothetical protein PGRAN_02490 [Listeria grandensis FSL F6-0971]